MSNFTRLQTISGGSGSSVTFGSNVTSGSLLVVHVAWFTSVNLTSVTDNRSNTYVQATGAQANNTALTEKIDTYYVLVANSGSTTITANFDGGTSFFSIHAREFSYTGGTCSFDVAANATGSSVFATTCSLTTAVDHECISSMVVSDNSDSSLPSGWANLANSVESYRDGSGVFTDAGTAGSVSGNFGLVTNPTNYGQTMVAFKVSSGTQTTSVSDALTMGEAGSPNLRSFINLTE